MYQQSNSSQSRQVLDKVQDSKLRQRMKGRLRVGSRKEEPTMINASDNNNMNNNIVERFLKANEKQIDELRRRHKKLQNLIKRSKESGKEPSVDVGEMLLALESVLEDAVKDDVITKEASLYIQDTMEEIAADHGYI